VTSEQVGDDVVDRSLEVIRVLKVPEPKGLASGSQRRTQIPRAIDEADEVVVVGVAEPVIAFAAMRLDLPRFASRLDTFEADETSSDRIGVDSHQRIGVLG
jgi:predicted aconitase with swiveling domain